MPKPRKRDNLGEAWEYTPLADDFSTFDADANDVTPPAATMTWRGYSYPRVANEITPEILKDGSSGPWWLPDDPSWISDCRLLNILCKAYFMESVPVIKDELLMTCSDIVILRREQVLIPVNSATVTEPTDHSPFRTLMRKLVICGESEKEVAFTALIDSLRKLDVQREASKKYNICLVKFPYRIWPEGLSHIKIHPIIVVPSDVYKRYHL